VWVYHGDEIPQAEQETERLRARALAQVSSGGASTGALITDEREAAEVAEVEPAPAVPEPSDEAAAEAPAQPAAAADDEAPDQPVAAADGTSEAAPAEATDGATATEAAGVEGGTEAAAADQPTSTPQETDGEAQG
jgi:hypothetical protein